MLRAPFSRSARQAACARALDRAEFIPQTIEPSEHFLSDWEALLASMRNPIELWDKALFSLPYRDIRRGGRRYIEIADPHLMHAVLVEHEDAFAKSDIQQRYIRPALGNGLLASEGADWRLQRPAAAPCFRARALELLIPAIERVGRASAERLAHVEGLTDVMPEIMRATFEVVAELLLGPDAHLLDQQAMAQAVTDYVETVALADWIDACGGANWINRPWPKRGARGLAAMRAEGMRALQGRRSIAIPREDLLARLLAARDRQTNAGMSDIDLRDNILTFVTAGNETTALTLTWALYLIAHDPDVQERMARESDRVLGAGPLTPETIKRLVFHHQVIQETMRLYPPIAILQRRALRPVTIGDIQVRKGDEVVCASYVMHRSTRLWERPERFDPERFSPERSQGRHKLALMPFGAGSHVCIGKPLAMMETVAILALLLQRLVFSPGPPRRIVPIMRLTVRPDGGMPLRVALRSGGEDAHTEPSVDHTTRYTEYALS